MSRLGPRHCLCCGADFLRGDVIGLCQNQCDYDWCRKCTKCVRHCKCAEGFQPFFGFQCAEAQQNPKVGPHDK